MPADFSPYIDLRIFDKSPGDIYRDSIELARLTLPDFNLRIGTPEDAMFQAMAYISALNIASINRVPSRLMSGLIGIMGYQRNEGVPAEVDIDITLGTYDGGVIPGGTTFIYSVLFEDEVQEFVFQTTESVTLDPTDLETSFDYPSTTVTVQAFDVGIMPPITAGETMSVISSGTDIASVVVSSPANFVNGLEPDDDADYLSGATTYLQSLSSCLATSKQIDSYVLTQFANIVGRCKTHDLTSGNELSGDISVKRTEGVVTTYLDSNLATIETDAPHLFVVGDVVRVDIDGSSVSAIFNGTHEITDTSSTTFSFEKFAGNSSSTSVTASAYAGEDVPGYASIFAYGVNRLLTASEKTEILADVSDKLLAGISCEILDPTLVTLEISGEVSIRDTFVLEQVISSIENALIAFLSPVEYPFSADRIRYNQIVSLVNSVPGVAFVESLEITPTGSGWLPRHGDDLLFRYKGTLPIISSDDIDISYTQVRID